MMADALYREFRLASPSVWAGMVKFIKSNARAMIDKGHPLRVIVTSEDRKRNTEQNARYWALLTDIADSAWVEGRQYSKEIWHEHFARMFLPLNEAILPTGEIIQIRETTTKLSVGAFSDYMMQVEAYAATNLGVEFQ